MSIHMDMLEVVLDHSTPIPLYYQFKQWLSICIGNGQLPPGARLPDELELCQRLGVSRGVVRQAIAGRAESHKVRPRCKWPIPFIFGSKHVGI